MGSNFSSWEGIEGAIYMGANTSWEGIWTLVSIGCCVVALIIGSRHELDAYKKMED